MVGYWFDPEDPDTKGFFCPQDWVDKHWDKKERQMVINYLKSGREVSVSKGYSWCRFRFCWTPDRKMGCCDLGDGTYVWPEGYVHYIEKHSVRPPEDFLEHVRSKLAELESQNS